MNKQESYTDETHRNRRKVARRREQLDAMAQAAGWLNWSEYETAVKNGLVNVAVKGE